ncbi:MAG: tetratricopeptide repeat protein [Magnetococcales bacterium]|nr:tetratricopeptide repeat protein [Magnetococcales bacterium]
MKAQVQGKTEEALQWYEKALKLADKLPRQTLISVRGGRCQILFAQSVQQQSPQLLNRALTECEQAILLKSDHAPWYVIRSRARAIRGEWEQAAEDISIAVLLLPDDASLLLDQARIMKNLRQNQAAIRIYGDFLKRNPDDHEAILERGALLLANGDPQRALNDFSHAKKLQPRHGETLRQRAATLVALERLPEAMADLDLSIQVEPENPESYLHRGSLRATQRLFRVATEDFQKAVNLRQNDPALLANLGLIQFLQGNFAEAELIFHKSATLQPEDPYAPLWRHLARKRRGVPDSVPSPPPLVDREWPIPLFTLFKGDTTPEETLLAAGRLSDPQARQAATTEALFFIAQHHLLRNDLLATRIWLERILADTNSGEAVLRLIAGEELQYLETPPLPAQTPEEQAKEPGGR